jgi:hypothetical protein
MPAVRTTTKGAAATGIKTTMFAKQTRPAAGRAQAPPKSEEEGVLSNIRHMLQNTVLFMTVTPQGKLVSSAMKISSFHAQVMSAYAMLMGHASLPEGFRADDTGFSLEPGKNKWDVAILRAFRSHDDPLWFIPSEGLALTKRAMDKFYSLPDEKGHPLARNFSEARAEILKKQSASPYKAAPFPPSAELLKSPEFGININAQLGLPNFTAVFMALVRACHAMTGALACSNMTEAAIARQPVSLAKFNQFLSAYVTEEPAKTATRTGGTFTTVLQLFRTLQAQMAENNRLQGQVTEHKFTTFEILDSNAGDKYSVKTQLKTAHAEDLSPPKGKTMEREKRFSIANVLAIIDSNARNHTTSTAIKVALLNRLRDDAVKAAATGTQPDRIIEADVDYLVSHVYFTHIAVALPGGKRTAYPAARLIFNGHGASTFSPNPMAVIMLYFFLKRYSLDTAADDLFNNVIADIIGKYNVEAAVFDHLKVNFTAKGDTGRSRGHTSSGFEAASTAQAREFETSAAAARQQALAAAAAATRRSPSPARHQTVSGSWNGQPQGEWNGQPSAPQQPSRAWAVPGAAASSGAAGSAAGGFDSNWAPRTATGGAAQAWAQPPTSDAAAPQPETWDPAAPAPFRAPSPGTQPAQAWDKPPARQGSGSPSFRAPSAGPAAGSWESNAQQRSASRQASVAQSAAAAPSPGRGGSGTAQAWDAPQSWTPGAGTGTSWQ